MYRFTRISIHIIIIVIGILSPKLQYATITQNFKFQYLTQDSARMGEITLIYGNDTNLTTTDSLVFNSQNVIDSNFISLKHLEINDYHNKFFKLVIQFEDTTKSSNLFISKASHSQYKLLIGAKKLHIIYNTSFYRTYKDRILKVAGITFNYILKILISIILLIILRLPLRLFNYILIINLLLIPALFYGLPAILPPYMQYYLLPEFLVFLVESLLLYFLIQRKVKLRQVLFFTALSSLIIYIFNNIFILLPYVI